jgi:hypothetical protein
MRIGDLVRVKPHLLNRNGDSNLLKLVFIALYITERGIVDVLDPVSLSTRSFYVMDMVVVCKRKRSS